MRKHLIIAVSIVLICILTLIQVSIALANAPTTETLQLSFDEVIWNCGNFEIRDQFQYLRQLGCRNSSLAGVNPAYVGCLQENISK